jgi:hypothetical protein
VGKPINAQKSTEIKNHLPPENIFQRNFVIGRDVNPIPIAKPKLVFPKLFAADNF